MDWAGAWLAKLGQGFLVPALAFVRGVNAAGFQQETPFGLEILQKNTTRIHAGPCCCWKLQENDGWACAGAQDWDEGFAVLPSGIQSILDGAKTLLSEILSPKYECSSTFLGINLGHVLLNKIISIFFPTCQK